METGNQPFRQPGHTQSFATLDINSLLSFSMGMNVHQQNPGEPHSNKVLHMPQLIILDIFVESNIR